jgi:hypothetical protein
MLAFGRALGSQMNDADEAVVGFASLNEPSAVK